MSWLSEAFQYLQEQFAPVVQEVDGRTFSNRKFTEIEPNPDPLHGQFEVSTLSAFRDLINANVEEIVGANTPLLHIANYQEVRLVTGVSDEHGRRRTFATAKPLPTTGFSFGNYLPLENFRVGIQAHFAHTPDREYLLDIASKATDAEVAVSEDDGVSQQITVQAGLSLKATEKLRARVTLAPFRTFPEVDQPKSEFIFRARKGGELALFEADGGKWKVAAVENIAFRLRDLGITLPVIA